MKSDLPEKTCPVCQRPFSWRKRWARCWEQVIYCSDACRRGTPRGRAGPAVSARAPATIRPSKTRR